MKAIVKRDKLVKIILCEFPYYTEEIVNEIIEEYGAQYFNGCGCKFNFRYIGFDKWEITDAE